MKQFSLRWLMGFTAACAIGLVVGRHFWVGVQLLDRFNSPHGIEFGLALFAVATVTLIPYSIARAILTAWQGGPGAIYLALFGFASIGGITFAVADMFSSHEWIVDAGGYCWAVMLVAATGGLAETYTCRAVDHTRHTAIIAFVSTVLTLNLILVIAHIVGLPVRGVK